MFVLQDDRRAADERLKKEQDKVDRALQAARNAGDKDREVKELAAQVHALTVSRCVPHSGAKYIQYLDRRKCSDSSVVHTAPLNNHYHNRIVILIANCIE